MSRREWKPCRVRDVCALLTGLVMALSATALQCFVGERHACSFSTNVRSFVIPRISSAI